MQLKPVYYLVAAGDGGGRGPGTHPVLRVDDAGDDVVLLLRRPAGDWARVQALPVRVAARGWRLRRERVHLSRAQASPQRHRVRGLLQHQPQQMAAGTTKIISFLLL